jgi:hypothetical protein
MLRSVALVSIGKHHMHSLWDWIQHRIEDPTRAY